MSKKVIFIVFVFFYGMFDSSFLLQRSLAETYGRVSDELEQAGGRSIGVAGASLLFNEIEALRLNPALLAKIDFYKIYAGYNFCTYGKDFYHLAVVDGNVNLKAALSYSSFLDLDFEDPFLLEADEGDDANKAYKFNNWSNNKLLDHFYGSQLKRRVTLGVAMNFAKFALGINGSYVEGWNRPYRSYEYEKQIGVVLGLGVVYSPMPRLDLGIAMDNLNNKKIVDLAASFNRWSVAYQLIPRVLKLEIGYLHRQRTRGEFVIKKDYQHSDEFNTINIESIFNDKASVNAYERSVVAGFKLDINQMWSFYSGYNHELFEDNGFSRKSLALGVSLKDGMFEISYNIKAPYLNKLINNGFDFKRNLAQSVSIALLLESNFKKNNNEKF